MEKLHVLLTLKWVGKSIRNKIEEIGGTMPEDLPTPNKSIKELEAEELNKLINSN